LGCTLWQMLTGHPPFHGGPSELMHQHLHMPLALERLSHVPQPVLVLVEMLLEKDPARRFQTPAQLLNALPTVTNAVDAESTVTRQSLQKESSADSCVVTRQPPARPGPKKISLARLPITQSDVFGREEDVVFLDAAWANQQVNVVQSLRGPGWGNPR
jgi:serine/threonine protein kinase